MAGGLGLLGVSVAPSPGAEVLPDTKAVFSALYSQTSHVTPEWSELGHSYVVQGEAAALSDAEHGLGRPISAGHPAGHLCLRVSAALPGPAPAGQGGWVGNSWALPLWSQSGGGAAWGRGARQAWPRLARSAVWLVRWLPLPHLLLSLHFLPSLELVSEGLSGFRS